MGEPITLGEPKPYISDKVKGLKLWDSQGIDKSGYNIDQLKNSVINLINTNAKENTSKIILIILSIVYGTAFPSIDLKQ